MPVRIIYARPTHTRSTNAQLDAWRSAGYEVDNDHAPVYVEGPVKRRDGKLQPASLTERAHAINKLALHAGQGDDIGVESLFILGLTEADILDTMAAIGAAGGAVYVLDQDRRITWHPDALELTRAIKDATTALRRDQMTEARRAAISTGSLGPKVKLSDAQKAKARQDWHDPKFESQQAVAEKWGVSASTLYNYFGQRFPPTAPPKRASR